MKLSINIDLNGQSGLQKFGRLLLEKLQQNHGVKIVNSNAPSDIHLSIINGSNKPRSKNILRLDGVYYDIKRLRLNSSIKRSIKLMDGVVYQSKWCQIFAETMLKVRAKKSTIIYNGAKPISNNVLIDKYGFEKVFICCANWRINKRLKSIVKSFLNVLDQTKTHLGLFIIGKSDYFLEHRNIKYFGRIDQGLTSFYKSSDYMCHICHLDACPNSVVEALLAGVPVLCNNIGGTPEIVRKSGIIIPLDKPFNFKPIKSMNIVGPKSINCQVLTKGMIDIMEHKWNIQRPDLDISVSAQKYYDFFKSFLG